MHSLPNAIRTAREKQGWTQLDLAERLQVSQGTISFWENGVEVPSLDHQVRLIETLPEVLAALADEELRLLDRIQALERSVFGGRCACDGCDCAPEASFTPLSAAARSEVG
jgi:transcriptional regulator with XRE-family HTH domain